MSELEEFNIFCQYKRIKRKSELLDRFIKEKILQIKESLLQPPVKLKQNLRVKISSSFNNETSEWNLRIEGRVMVKDKEVIFDEDKNLKMLNFFEKIFIDFEKEDQRSYMNIDWRKLNSVNDLNYDAIDITRSMIPGRDSINIVIKFFKDYSPKEFVLSSKLSKLLNIKQGNIMKIINSLWQYIKLNRLQDRDRRNIINCNKELEEVFNKESFKFSQINGLLRQHLSPINPLEVNFTITNGVTESKILDIPVEICSKYRYDQEDFIVANNINLITDENSNEERAFGAIPKIEEVCPFDMEGLSQTDKSILQNMSSCLRASWYKCRFYKEYCENPKLKIQNTILEQMKYLDIIQRKELDLAFDLENEEEYSQFYKENQWWLKSEVESYENSAMSKIEKENNILKDLK